MQEQLVSFKVAKLAKEKGFDIPVLNCYNENGELGDVESLCFVNYNQFKDVDGSNTNMYSAPTKSLLQKWLREKHNILVEPCWEGTHEIYSINYRIIILGNTIYKDFRGCFDGQSYEQALEVGLQEALKLINNYE